MAPLIQLFGWSAIWKEQQLLVQVCQQLSTWPLSTVQLKFPSLSFQHRRDIVLFFATTVKSRFQASTAMSFISSLFWDVTQHMLAVGYRRFGTTYRPSIKVSSSPRPLTETRTAWRTSAAETSMLPVAETVAWMVLECMWSTGTSRMTLTCGALVEWR